MRVGFSLPVTGYIVHGWDLYIRMWLLLLEYLYCRHNSLKPELPKKFNCIWAALQHLSSQYNDINETRIKLKMWSRKQRASQVSIHQQQRSANQKPNPIIKWLLENNRYGMLQYTSLVLNGKKIWSQLQAQGIFPLPSLWSTNDKFRPLAEEFVISVHFVPHTKQTNVIFWLPPNSSAKEIGLLTPAERLHEFSERATQINQMNPIQRTWQSYWHFQQTSERLSFYLVREKDLKLHPHKLHEISGRTVLNQNA